MRILSIPFFSIVFASLFFVSVASHAQPNGSPTIGDYEPKECFASDGKHLPFADMAAYEKGTRAYAFHPLGLDIDVASKVAEIFIQAEICDEARDDYEAAVIDYGANSPQADAAKQLLCTDEQSLAHLQQAKLALGSWFPKLQSWTKDEGQHNISPWPQSVPVSVASVRIPGVDLTFFLEERLLKYAYTHFNRELDSEISEKAGKGELPDATLAVARIALYNGDNYIRDYDLPHVSYPTSIYTFRAEDKPYLVILDKTGGAKVEHYVYDVTADMKAEFVEGQAHFYAIETDDANNVSLNYIRSQSSGGVHPNNFLQYDGKFVVVNQGGWGEFNGPENPAFGTVALCDNQFLSCDSHTLRSDVHLPQGWLHGHAWHSAILGTSVYFTDLNVPNLVAEMTVTGEAACKSNFVEIDNAIDSDLADIDEICEGVVGVTVDIAGKSITTTHGGNVDVYNNLELITESLLLPEGNGTDMLRDVSADGEFVIAPAIKQAAFVLDGPDGYDFIFRAQLEDGGAPDTFTVSKVKGGAQGIVNLWFEGELFAQGGFKVRIESANSSWIGEYNLASGELDYHYIKSELPIRHTSGDGFFFKHNDVARSLELGLGVGHSWSALERILFKGAGPEGKDLEALGLASLNSLDAIAIVQDEAGDPKALGMFTPSTDNYASNLETLYKPEWVSDLIKFFIYNEAYTPSDITSAAVSAVNSITTLFGGVNDFKFYPGGEDFDLMARFGMPFDLFPEVIPAPKMETGQAISLLPEFNIGGPSEPPVVRMGRLYLAMQSLWPLPQALAGPGVPKKHDDYDDEDGYQILRDGVPQVRFPSQVTCLSVGPYVPFDEDIFGEPGSPGVAGIDSIGINPTFLALKFPRNCHIVDLASGRVIVANESQHSGLYARCSEKAAGKFNPKGKHLELAKITADYLWKGSDQLGDQLNDADREAMITKISELRGKDSGAIETVMASLQGEATAVEADVLDAVDDDWQGMWEQATCGKAGCYAESLRGMPHIQDKLLTQGDGSPRLSIRNGQIGYSTMQTSGGGGCSLIRNSK